jgi:predicted transcriptional regulator
MQGAILYTNSNKELKLILELAQKIGISTKKLTLEDLEDLGLVNAINEGRTGEFIDTESYLKELLNGNKD